MFFAWNFRILLNIYQKCVNYSGEKLNIYHWNSTGKNYLSAELWSFKISSLPDNPCTYWSHYNPWYCLINLCRKATIFLSVLFCSISSKDYLISFPRLIELNGVEKAAIDTLKSLWSLCCSWVQPSKEKQLHVTAM